MKKENFDFLNKHMSKIHIINVQIKRIQISLTYI